MGYELKMFIVKKSFPCTSIRLGLIDGKVYNVFEREVEGVEEMYYYPDGNTRAIVPFNAHVIYRSSFMDIIGMVDLCKPTYLNISSICKFEDSDGTYMYGLNGGTLIGLDSYGDYRRFVPLDKCIKAMKESNEDNPYRRYDIALAMMKAVKKGFKGDDIGCVFYGH